jgi:adenylate kinase
MPCYMVYSNRMNSPKTYVFFGIVGAGKGTQIELLKKALAESDTKQIVYVYPGNEFRKLTSAGTYTGTLVKQTLEAGELQPLFLTAWTFTQAFLDMADANSHVIIDAFPRNLEQIPVLESAISFYGRSNVEIVYIEISKEEAIKRMKLRGRSDDTDEGITRRFYEYETNVIPAMEEMQKKGYTLHKINGEQPVEAVHGEMKAALGL